MRKFSYKAKKEGIDISGIIEAKGEKEAAKLLHEQNLFVVSVIPERKQNILFFKNRVGLNDVVNLTRQLSSMITAGLTITEALSVLGSEVENPLLGQILEEILTDVEAGNSLSAAMAKHPKVFSSVYIAMITAAEEAGLLDKVLARLADNLEKEKAFRGKIIGALIYPIIVVVGMVAVGVIMMLFVIPTVRGLYQDLGVDLPAMTQVVLAISDFMVKGWPLLAGLGALLFFAFSSYKKTDLGQRQLDTILLRAPVIGKLRKLIILTEFSRTLGLLIGSGSPIIESINITGNTTGSIWYKESLTTISKKVEKGVALGDAMAEDSRFPSILVQMSKVGETTGKLDEALLRVSGYFESEAEQSIKTLTTALEPLIMIFLGIGVAVLIIAVIMPIYSLTSAF